MKSVSVAHHRLFSPVASVAAGRALLRRGAVVKMDAAAVGADIQPDFEQLIVAVARDRDCLAFTTLFGHFAPRVKSYLMRSGTPAARAEELAQETLLMLWRKADRFDPARARASTWVFVIARNLRIDALRREKATAELLDDTRDQIDTSDGADEVLATSEQEQLVREAFNALPEEQSKVIRLSFFLDKPHAEIAAELGIPLGTVKSRIRLALKRLAERLGDC
jgi:RNA polymerase sigma-70 factor (ECF subfamily)